MKNRLSTCATCGHTWRYDVNGDHSCVVHLQVRVQRLEEEREGLLKMLAQTLPHLRSYLPNTMATTIVARVARTLRKAGVEVETPATDSE